MQMEGHHGKACRHASQREAKRSSPTLWAWRQFAAQELQETACLESRGRRRTSCAGHGNPWRFEAVTWVGMGPVIVTTADAPTRKLSSGFSTWIRTGKRCASRTQSRLRGTFGSPCVLVPYSGLTAQPGPTTLP